MFEEIKNSVQKVLSERAVSPLAGTFIISWCLWNWEIFILFFFSSDDISVLDKIFYIKYFGSNACNVFVKPIISTIAILLLYPLFSNSTYWLWLRYDVWKKKIKDEIEGSELLTLKESAEIKYEVEQQFRKAADILNDKDTEIKSLNEEIAHLRTFIVREPIEKTLLEEIKRKEDVYMRLKEVFDSYSLGTPIDISKIPSTIKNYFINENIIYRPAGDLSKFELGSMGLNMYKLYIKEAIEEK
ncbi:hypothetical protein EHQ53_15160 [Leptospira langatensis]|uniref:Uncharacterized protein n=1 Tax=Leptospira langatensis TaxID=2484983 RepID=A0A5F1ZSD7_9LEPT|nr:hypothetical protein [Leptospira langatensis]TGK01811.1 hypothetical protein EHO57_08400 [Leptospira langatensis]TGL39417.1 hypothetical protein EHQ53_15160 [Leptospira langatensis]